MNAIIRKFPRSAEESNRVKLNKIALGKMQENEKFIQLLNKRILFHIDKIVEIQKQIEGIIKEQEDIFHNEYVMESSKADSK